MTNLVDTIAALEAERDHLRVEVERKHERITHLDARLEAEVEFRGTLIDMIAKLIADRDRMVNAITAAKSASACANAGSRMPKLAGRSVIGVYWYMISSRSCPGGIGISMIVSGPPPCPVHADRLTRVIPTVAL